MFVEKVYVEYIIFNVTYTRQSFIHYFNLTCTLRKIIISIEFMSHDDIF